MEYLNNSIRWKYHFRNKTDDSEYNKKIYLHTNKTPPYALKNIEKRL